MSRYKLPILFLNLSGEMIYILDQRLRAQHVPEEKAKRVLNDIISIMFNQRFLEELFNPQDVYNKEALRSVFSDLAHASIMRLNEESMSKLYDLMRMVFKYQVFASCQPRDLILVTLNHLDAIRSVCCNQAIQKQVDNAYVLLIKTFGQMGSGELQRLRFHILNFFQDMRIRVSIFMRQKIQNNYGSFVIPASSTVPNSHEIPGSIRVYDQRGRVVDLLTFEVGRRFSQRPDDGSTEMRGPRGTPLGTNIYTSSMRESDGAGSGVGLGLSEGQTLTRAAGVAEAGSAHYREELNLLVRQLASGNNTTSSRDVITLDLFNDLDTISRTPQLQIVANTESEENHNESLHKVLTEMTVDGSGNETSANSSVSVVDLIDALL